MSDEFVFQEAVAKMQESLSDAESDLFETTEDVSLNKFSIGPLIGIGANAVVHAVKKKPATGNFTFCSQILLSYLEYIFFNYFW